MKPPVLRCRHVTKRYGKFTALQDLSLEVYEGEIFALLGPNGAGKSTLIHCITGLAKQSQGSIEVLGFDTVRDFRTTRRLVGLVPQEISYDPFFTPLESLMIQMGLMGVEPNRERAESLLTTFALDEKRDAYTRTLSGGMKRRLLVAKSLVHEPRLLFLDEPTAGVDVELRRELWQEVQDLRAAGTTIVLTTHYIEEAEKLADRIGILHNIYLELIRKADGRHVA
jgi:ABC-2 type transport system ATP-binding protein